MINLSKQLQCGLTFRIAEETDYYNNYGKLQKLSEEQMKLVIALFFKFRNSDKYMNAAYNFYKTGINDLMIDYDKKRVICGAGKDFVFIQSNGDIYPCIYSKTIIGNLNGFLQIHNDYICEKCPCMTECSVWPVIIRNEKYDK